MYNFSLSLSLSLSLFYLKKNIQKALARKNISVARASFIILTHLAMTYIRFHRLLLSQCHALLFCFMAFFSKACKTITRFISFYSFLLFSFLFFSFFFFNIECGMNNWKFIVSLLFSFLLKCTENFIQLDDSFIWSRTRY